MRKKYWLVGLIFSVALADPVSNSSCVIIAQTPASQQISIESNNERLPRVFKKLEKASGYKIMFIVDEMNRYTFSGKISTRDIHAALKQIIGDKPLDYSIEQQFINVTIKDGLREKSSKMRITGKIVDENGAPIPGASISIVGSRFGTASNLDGEYVLRDARYGDAIMVTFVGYKPETVLVKDKDKINIRMSPNVDVLGDVTVVAFGQQKTKAVTGAVSTVKPGDLKMTSPDLTTAFAGKIPGMIAWQTGGLPGALTEDEMNTKFYIRGITSFQSGANVEPLILLDGVESSKLDLARMQVEDIESFSVLKDASATAMYGARGANGVILVTTKKGEEGSVYTTARYEMNFNSPTKEIETSSPIDYMKYYNEAIMSRSATAMPRYTQERIANTMSGRYPSWVYPANDWYDILFKNFSINHEAGVTIRGGSNVIQYYSSLNYIHEEGMLKSDRLNEFDCNISNNQIQFRTNLNINLSTGIRLVINSNTNIDRYHGPSTDQKAAYGNAFNASPVDFAPTYPADATYSWPHIRFGTTLSNDYNPYMANQRGYKERTRYSSTNKAEYIQNLGQWIKGLELRLSTSIVQSGYYDNNYTTVPFKYALTDYDTETGVHKLTEVNNYYSDSKLRAGANNHSTDTRITYEGRVYHAAAWADHQTAFTGIMQMYERTFTPISDVLNGMPQRNLTYSGRFQYGFKDRYFVEGTLAYNGSERFAKQNRMGFFPALGANWVISDEEWMKPVLPYLSYFKVRYSWGKAGNDGIISTPRYVYLQDIGIGNKSVVGKDITPYGQNWARNIVRFYGDNDIRWEVAETHNVGIDLKLFNGIFEMETDIYKEYRHNILDTRYVIPANVGIEVAPLDNIGETESKGIDISAKLQHQFNNDFWFILNGTLTYNKCKYKYIEEATDKPAWQIRKGKEISQSVGYIAEGLFRDQAEIDNSPRQDGDVMPGDIKYRDLNNDGVIDVNDATFIGYPETPRLIYGFSAFVNYKKWEFSCAFQGSGKRSFFMNAESISPFYRTSDGDSYYQHALLKAIADDHWSEDNQAERPFWPRLSTNNITYHNPQEDWNSGAEVRKSTYFMRECKFLRCTSIALAYNLPRKWLDKAGMKTCKISFTTNNPFLISNFKVWDVELGENGFNYPIQKSYSVGINVGF